MKRQSLLAIALLVQACCTVLFVADILGSVLGIESVLLSWQTHELLEIGALLGLVLGFVLGALALLRAQRDARQAEAGLKRAQSAFADGTSMNWDGVLTGLFLGLLLFSIAYNAAFFALLRERFLIWQSAPQ